MRFLKWAGLIALLLIISYYAGPKPAQPKLNADLPAIPSNAVQLEEYIAREESLHKVKPGNEARLVWFNDSTKEITEYAVVYLHGFSASREEGNPVHQVFANTFGCNLFLPRLADHGLDTTEAMVNLTADKLWNTAKEAIAIGRQIGKKVILMSTSTGGTLALKLAATYPEIAALILLSPNVAINDPNAWLLNNPWGLQIARLVTGSRYVYAKDTTAEYKKYWYSKYRMESVTELEELLESTMKASVFEKIQQPVLLLYYYKDEAHQDPVVKVSAMKRMFSQLATPPYKKREVAIPDAGDHVIGSALKSKDFKKVIEECEKFGKEILQMKPVFQ